MPDYTVKEIADSLCINKQRVSRYIKLKGYKPIRQGAQKQYYSEYVKKQILSHFENLNKQCRIDTDSIQCGSAVSGENAEQKPANDTVSKSEPLRNTESNADVLKAKDELIDVLKQQLEEKEKHINELFEQLEKKERSLQNAQELQFMTEKNLQHANVMLQNYQQHPIKMLFAKNRKTEATE